MLECYEYQVCLGEGAFGTIYKVYDKIMGREAALKVYKNLEQFHNECKLWKTAQKMPGLVDIYDCFEENGTGYLVMEYLSGGSLKEYLLQQPGKRFAPQEALELLTPVMYTLVRLHAKGLVHCDISPDNVMFAGSGEAKLIDLGAAKLLGTEQEARMLKTQYAAPEQYANPDKIGPWTDVYEICALLYVMISGEKVPEATSRIKQDNIRELGFWTEGVEQAETAIMRGLQMEIQKRYFQLELFMQACEVSTEEIAQYNEPIRRQWGKLWISISAQGRFAAGASKQKISPRNRKRIRWGLLLAGLSGTLIGIGLTCCKDELTEASFLLKRKWAQTFVSQEDDMRLFTAREKDFAEKLQYLQTYGTVSSKDEESVSYEIGEAEFMNWGCKNNWNRKMYLDQATLYEICCFYLELDPRQVKETYGDFTSWIYWYRYETESLQISAKNSWEYSWEEESLKIEYDPSDDRVFSVELKTDDRAQAESCLKKVLPFCCPETYLEDHETEEILLSAETEDSSMLCLNEKSWLYVYSYQSGAERYYSCKIAACFNALW